MSQVLSPDVHDVGERVPCTHAVLVAGEFDGDDAAVRIEGALRGLGSRCLRVTVAVVALPQRALSYGLPFCGVAVIEQASKDLRCDAHRRACRLASGVAEVAPAEHLVLESWGELLRHARARGYDTVLVPEPPSRLGDRLAVRRARLVTVAQPSVSDAPKRSTNASSSTGRRRSFAGKPRSG